MFEERLQITFRYRLPINLSKITHFSLERQPRGTDAPGSAKWRHNGASCMYVWRHIF